MLKSQHKCDILILTEPVELVGMLKSQLKCTILILTEPVELVGMLKSQQMRYLNSRTSGVGGNAKNHNLNARYLNSHWTSGVGGNAKITT
jgi:peptide subunit release factor 1 (eRF1)